MDTLEYSFIYLSEDNKEKVDGDVARFHRGHNLSTPLFTGKDVVFTHPFLLPLLTKVARNHSAWGFCSTYMRLAPDKKEFKTAYGIIEAPQYCVSRVDVYARKGKERIGTVGVDTSHITPRFKLDSPPLKRTRKRGYNTYTKDIDKASRLINKSFFPRTLEERVDDMHSTLRTTLRSSASSKGTAYNNQWRGIRQHLRKHIEENWETFAPVCVGAGMEEEVANTFLKAKHEAGVLEKLSKSHTSVFVWLEDNRYMVRTQTQNILSKERMSVYTTDDLPTKYKQKIGMLKMLDDEHAVAGVGYRLHANSFLIFEEELDA